MEQKAQYALKEDQTWLAKGFVPAMLGMLTKVTMNSADAWATDDRSVAEKLLPKLNLSPYAKWQVVEVVIEPEHYPEECVNPPSREIQYGD